MDLTTREPPAYIERTGAGSTTGDMRYPTMLDVLDSSSSKKDGGIVSTAEKSDKVAASPLKAIRVERLALKTVEPESAAAS